MARDGRDRECLTQILIDFISRRGLGSDRPRHQVCSQLALTDDVILEMEILERGGTSQGRRGDALQSVSVQTQLLKYVLFTKDPDKHIEIERYIFRFLLVTHYEVI